MGQTVTFDELLEVYLRRNPERSVQAVKNDLIAEANKAHQSGDAQRMYQADFLLLQIQEYEQKQANTPPPPKQKPYAAPQTNGANQAPPQTNTTTTPDGYNAARALADLVIYAASGTAIFYGLVWLGGAVTGAAKGIANGVMSAMETVTPYAVYAGIGFVALIGAKEFFTKKETPTTQTGGTGYIVNNYYYGDGTTAERK